jgi:transcriptional regulator with XRE-family HTH domain
MTDTLATIASPSTSANPGELGPSATPAPSPKPPAPDAPRATFEQRRHAQDQAAASDAAPPAADPAAPPAPAQGEKFKVGKFEVSEDEVASMMDRQAQDDLRAATRPANPEEYKAELPADLKLPGGQTYAFDQNNPSLVAARNLAHAKGWSQQDFSEALGIFASHIAGEQAALAERSQQEIAKIGANGPQRVDAVGRWITGEVGEADARPIRATIVTDAHLRFYEKLMNKITSQGAASFSQSHRVAPDTDAIPGYANMSFEQRREAQDRNAARRR